jgi:hypothetical protein
VTSIVRVHFSFGQPFLTIYHYFFSSLGVRGAGPDRTVFLLIQILLSSQFQGSRPDFVASVCSPNSVPVTQDHLKRSKANQISFSDVHETSSDSFSPLTYYTSWCAISRHCKQTLSLPAFNSPLLPWQVLQTEALGTAIKGGY